MISNRRQFIKKSALIAGASVAALSPLAAFHFGRRIDSVGLQLWSVAKYLQQDFAGILKLISQTGYKEVELYGPYPFSSEKDMASWNAITPMLGFSQSGYFGRTAKAFKQVLDDHGLRCPAMHVGLDTLRNKMSEMAEAAHTLGQNYAGLAAIPDNERKTLDDYKRMADDFNKIGESAKANGIRFYYHNHGYGLSPVDGKIPFDLLLEHTDPSLVFLEMDVYWTVAGGADPVKLLDAHAGRYKLMHVKDMKKNMRFSGDGGNPQQWMELFPNITDAGTGVLDLTTIIAHAKKTGLEHFIVENDVVTDPEKSLEVAYKFVSTQ